MTVFICFIGWLCWCYAWWIFPCSEAQARSALAPYRTVRALIWMIIGTFLSVAAL